MNYLDGINPGMKEIIDNLDSILERRHFLYSRVPSCPECKSEQVQIIDSQTMPAKWQCRKCKHDFECEPSSTQI